MKIPNKVRIDGEIWTVKKVKNTLDSDYLGRTFPHDHQILLNTDAKGIDSTFLHELNHVIDKNRSLGLTEQQICSFSSGLYAIIVDNKLNFIE